MNRICCVYGIEINNKWYIGSTVDYTSRIKTHLNNLRKNHNYNPKMQKEYNETGEFNPVILKRVDIRKSLTRYENYFIGKYDAIDNGFNGILAYKRNDGDLSKKIEQLNKKITECLVLVDDLYGYTGIKTVEVQDDNN